MPGNDPVFTVGQYWVVKSKLINRIRYLVNLMFAVSPGVFSVRDKLVNVDVLNFCHFK